jgi:hypothetical protein
MAWSRRFVPQSTINRRMNQRDERINRELEARQQTPTEVFAQASMQQSVSVNILLKEHQAQHDEGAWTFDKWGRRSPGNPYALKSLKWAAWEMGFRAAEARDK